MYTELTLKGKITLSIEKLASNATHKMDRLISNLSDTLDTQIIDLKYGPTYRNNLLDQLINEVNAL